MRQKDLSKHWILADWSYIQIAHPNYVNVYNKNIGGVDVLDSNFDIYGIDVFQKEKWH